MAEEAPKIEKLSVGDVSQIISGSGSAEIAQKDEIVFKNSEGGVIRASQVEQIKTKIKELKMRQDARQAPAKKI